MAQATVTLAQFQSVVLLVGGPIIYNLAGSNVNEAIILSSSGASIGAVTFSFSPRPTEAAFLALFDAAIRVGNIQP